MSQVIDLTVNNYSSLASKIKNELIDPTYYNDVESNLICRSNLKIAGDILEIFSKIFIGISSVFAFAAGFFGYKYMSFISGCTSLLALLFYQFSSYTMKESKERNDIVNRIFKKIGLDDMVNIAVDQDDVTIISNFRSTTQHNIQNTTHTTPSNVAT